MSPTSKQMRDLRWPDRLTIPQTMREIERLHKSLTYTQIGAQIGVSEQTVRNWATGKLRGPKTLLHLTP